MPLFQPGQSGNPKGRPKKTRALTDLLERAGSATVEFNGQNISGKRLMARMVWSGVLSGEVEFPGGKKMRLSPSDWKAFVQWIYTHIDGPPKAEMDITSAGDAITFVIKRDDEEDDKPVPEAT
jgi:hypothetical protein